MNRWLRTLGFAIAAVLGWPFAHADALLDALPIRTQHRGVFNQKAVEYTASVEQTLIKDGSGAPFIRFVTTAYVRSDGDRKARPVLFLFNGGPSSASILLHMVGLGPKHIEVPQDPKAPGIDPPRLVDNPHSVLDVADLVFVDPPETGFSRTLTDAAREQHRSTTGDAEAVANFLRRWLDEHDRTASPKYVLGESYGTIRAALMSGMLAKDLPLDGVFLFGQAVNMVETAQRAKNALGHATNLPSLAAVARYHGKVQSNRPMQAFLDEVYEWAMRDYVRTLIAGRDAPAPIRERVANRLESYTGISADYFLRHDLGITKVEFARELLKSEGQIVAAYDARYAGPAPKLGERAVDPFAKVSSTVPAALRRYFAETLKVGAPMTEYREFTPDSGRWTYTPTGGAGGPFWDYDYQASLQKAFDAKPTFTLVIGTGIYDLTTTLGPARYLVSQSAFPSDRVFLRQYEGGHMAYTHEPARAAFSNDVRDFVTGRMTR